MSPSGPEGPKEPWSLNQGYPGNWPSYQPYRPRPRGTGILKVIAILLVIAIGFYIMVSSSLQEIEPQLPEEQSYFDPSIGGLQSYYWGYRYQAFQLSLNLSLADYLSYRQGAFGHAPQSYEQMRDFVLPMDPNVRALAHQLTNLSMAGGLDAQGRVGLALAFVQSLPYSLDEETTGQSEYWRYPTETLYDKTGDCEDTATLFASILEALHFDAVLIVFPQHVATGVDLPGATGTNFELNGVHYFYCETTRSGWGVGEIPHSVSMVLEDVVQVP
jgi:transglutaminase-like putative cysteine protease